MFIEASAPRVPGNRADLQSQVFQPLGPRCINFWANMHGANVGTLRVNLVPANSSAGGNNATIWELSQTDKGVAWFQGSAPFNSLVPYYVRFPRGVKLIKVLFVKS